MGRPGTGRTERFELRMTPEEAASLARVADEGGYATVTDYARARLLDASPRRSMSADRAAVIRVLSGIGERLNFLVRMCASDEGLLAESSACLVAVREAITSLGS